MHATRLKTHAGISLRYCGNRPHWTPSGPLRDAIGTGLKIECYGLEPRHNADEVGCRELEKRWNGAAMPLKPKYTPIKNGHRLTDVLTIFTCRSHPTTRIGMTDDALVNYLIHRADLRCPKCRHGQGLVVVERKLVLQGKDAPAPWPLLTVDDLAHFTETVPHA